MVYKPFSVIMSVYEKDDPVFFTMALESIIVNQTIKPNEIVLIVDGPISNELDNVINRFLNSNETRMIVKRFETNRGLGNVLKIASELCTNELIARMDSDDISVNNRFEQQLEFFSLNPSVDVVGGDISEFIGDETNIISYRRVPCDTEEINLFLKKRCPFNHVSVMMKKSALLKSGGYQELHYNEDYYLWVRMFLSGCIFKNTGTVLVNVRTGIDQFSRRGGLKYFKSEYAIQKLLLKNHIISVPLFVSNTIKRFLIQCLAPNFIRSFMYKKFARRTR